MSHPHLFSMKRYACRLLLSLSVLLPMVATAKENTENTRVLSRDAIVAKYTTPQSHFAEIEGINVHYYDEGTGPAILLVHGSLGALTDWDGWAKELKKDFRVVRLDLPAFGLTGEIPSGNYSADRMLSLIDGLMDHLNIERFAIAGISYGGLIAFRYAATRVNRTAALILLNSAGIQYGGNAKKDKAQAKQNKPMQPRYNIFTDPVVKADNVREFYKDYVNNQAQVTDELIQRKVDYLNILNRGKEAVISRQQYERGDPVRVLSHVKAPALVLWGEANNALQTKTASMFVDALKNSRDVELITYKGAGHMINIDIPEKSVADTKAFLNKFVKPKSWE